MIKITSDDILIHKAINSSNVAIILQSESLEVAAECKRKILREQRISELVSNNIHRIGKVLDHYGMDDLCKELETLVEEAE